MSVEQRQEVSLEPQKEKEATIGNFKARSRLYWMLCKLDLAEYRELVHFLEKRLESESIRMRELLSFDELTALNTELRQSGESQDLSAPGVKSSIDFMITRLGMVDGQAVVTGKVLSISRIVR